jgi:hypothetical protein
MEGAKDIEEMKLKQQRKPYQLQVISDKAIESFGPVNPWPWL